jgi:superfamily II DNA or RNA helicase
LDILRGLYEDIEVYECNGFKSDPVPEGDKWIYLVQYIAGSEAWNCTTTDAMVLYSLTYSYKNFVQSMGRIDRLDSPYTDLYYYILVSNSVVDFEIRKALKNKKNFNERKISSDFGKLPNMTEQNSSDLELVEC